MSSDRVARAAVDDLLDLRWRVLRAGRPRETARLPGDDAQTTRHWALRRDGRVIACVTVLHEEGPDGPAFPWRLRGMAVDGGFQGQGLGGALLDAVQAEVAAPLWCDARLAAVPFYRRHGWQVVSPVYQVSQVGPHHRMTWRPPEAGDGRD